MEDEFLSISPDKFGGQKTEPYVSRLPNGHVRMKGTSVLFPDSCPRCGSTPAATNVRLYLAKSGDHSVKLPFCRPCGWALNFVQYAFIAVMVAFTMFFFPHLKIPNIVLLSKLPPAVTVIAFLWIVSLAFEQIFKLLFKPKVEIVSMQDDCAELAFEDQMYAEKFVELNC